MNEKLANLLENLSLLKDNEIEQWARDLYAKLYLDRPEVGKRESHDGKLILFFGRQFEHAFYTTDDRVNRLYAKDKVCRDRAARIRWIGPIIRGRIEKVECWRIRTQDWQCKPKALRFKRAYVHWDTGYIVWLEPRRDGGWKFSTAYVAGVGDLRRYTQRGMKIWPEKESAP